MNPRAATNDLLPFQGSPFNLLGTSAWLTSHLLFCSRQILMFALSGESGIRTHAPFRTNGFQDRLVMTTSISLQTCFSILQDRKHFVKSFFIFFQKLVSACVFHLPYQRQLSYNTTLFDRCQHFFCIFLSFILRQNNFCNRQIFWGCNLNIGIAPFCHMHLNSHLFFHDHTVIGDMTAVL